MKQSEKLALLETVAEIRSCEWCSKPFAAVKSRHGKFCSNKCKQASFQAAKKEIVSSD